MKPDISYDIDGDGHVSSTDFFLAKKFDSNNDGILDNDERQKCLTALKNGLEK